MIARLFVYFMYGLVEDVCLMWVYSWILVVQICIRDWFVGLFVGFCFGLLCGVASYDHLLLLEDGLLFLLLIWWFGFS